MKRICVVANFNKNKGGLLVATEALIVELEKLGYTIFEAVHEEKRILRLPRTFLFLLRFVHQYDQIIVSIGAKFSFLRAILAIFVGKIFNKPVIVWCHSGDIDKILSKWFWLLIPLYKSIKAVVVPSEWSHACFEKYGISTKVIMNPFNVEDWIFRERNIIRPTILFAKNLNYSCGGDLALKAFKLIQQKYPNVSITLTGEGVLLAYLKKYVVQNKLKNVFFIGKVPYEKMSELYCQHDILLLPSREESFGYTLLEASMSGLVIVASRVGNIAKYIIHGKNGYLVEPEDYKAMSVVVVKILKEKKNFLKRPIMVSGNNTIKQWISLLAPSNIPKSN